MYTNFLNHYSKAKLEKKDFKKYFKEKGYNNIAIYGFGTTGKLLYNEIKNNINICCIIDKSVVSKDIDIIKPDDIGNYKNISKIIVTPYIEFFNIRNNLRKYTDVDIISLRSILSELKSEEDMIELSNFLLEKNVQLHFCVRPNIGDIDNPSSLEQSIIVNNNIVTEKRDEYFKKNIFNDIDADIDYVDYLDNLFNISSFEEERKVKILDKRSKYVNIINSYRYIPDYPDVVDKKIYIFGDCSAYGHFAEDERTAANLLQKKLNNNKLNYGIHAYAIVIKDILYFFELIKKLPLKEGELIIYINRQYNCDQKFFYNLENIYEHDLTFFFNRPHKYGEIFIDDTHIANRGQMLLGDALYNCIKDKLSSTVIKSNVISFNKNLDSILEIKQSEGLNNYVDYLKKEKVEIDGIIGCIVMNCNPFTLGHLYLIEKTCTYVDILYIFCIEEDTSIFKFKERFQLLVENTKHLKNVKILKSGKYILSSLTFNNYFTKESIQNITIDATYDLEIFCQYIAPTLNISIRFAGTEPICKITSQYNRDMKHILPQYNIQFKEIERKKLEENVISATKVRDLIWKKDLEGISKLVPEKTLHFIEENISELIKRIKEK